MGGGVACSEPSCTLGGDGMTEAQTRVLLAVRGHHVWGLSATPDVGSVAAVGKLAAHFGVDLRGSPAAAAEFMRTFVRQNTPPQAALPSHISNPKSS